MESDKIWLTSNGRLCVNTTTLVFKPYHFEVLNLSSKNSILPATSSLSEKSCDNREFNLNGRREFKVYEDDNFNFLSVGPLGDLTPFVEENRIFGTIEGSNIPHDPSLELSLLVIQNGVIIAREKISECAEKFLFSESPKNKITYGKKKNFVRYLFAIPFTKLSGIDTSPGSKVSLALKATWSGQDTQSEKLSNVTEVSVLSAIQISKKERWLNYPDTYDSKGYNLLRTGGDKWMLPHASLLIKSILEKSPGWKVNDASKLNGGKFEIHDSHKDGLDVDIFNNFNFACFAQEANGDEGVLNNKWFQALNNIENFLTTLKKDLGYIDLIYLTRDQGVIDNKNCFSAFPKKFVESRFENRCLEGRLINLDEGGVKSLLTHWRGHHDHLHMKFNAANELGFIEYVPLDKLPVEEFSLTSVKFELNGNKLEISPRFLHEFDNKTILWRLQDKAGFLDPNAHIDYGKWLNDKIVFNYNKPSFNDSDTYWVYVTIGDTRTGQCVQHETKISISDKKISIIGD